MNYENDSWGAKPFIPWVLIVVGALLMPDLWPLGAVLIAAGVAMIVSSVR